MLPEFVGDSNRGSFSVRQSGRSRTSQKLQETTKSVFLIFWNAYIGVRLFSQLHSKLIKVKLISGSMKNINLHWGSTFREEGGSKFARIPRKPGQRSAWSWIVPPISTIVWRLNFGWSQLGRSRGGFLVESRFFPLIKHLLKLTSFCLVFLEERLGRTKNRRIFVYNFCLINICLSLCNDANKIKTLNIERA